MPDNPLVGNGVASDGDRHIAYGLRNPFRFTFRPGTNELWVGDVGWDTWEEIDRIPNPTDSVVEDFGWPRRRRGPAAGLDNLNVNMCEQLYAAAGAVTTPWWAYRHDAGPDQARCGNGGSAISGLASPGRRTPRRISAASSSPITRRRLWAMMPGANGLPDPTNIKTILSNSLPGRRRDRA
jgi:hypothetical protein